MTGNLKWQTPAYPFTTWVKLHGLWEIFNFLWNEWESLTIVTANSPICRNAESIKTSVSKKHLVTLFVQGSLCCSSTSYATILCGWSRITKVSFFLQIELCGSPLTAIVFEHVEISHQIPGPQFSKEWFRFRNAYI